MYSWLGGVRGEFIRNDYQLFYVHNILLLTADRVRLGATAGEWYGMVEKGNGADDRPTDPPPAQQQQQKQRQSTVHIIITQ